MELHAYIAIEDNNGADESKMSEMKQMVDEDVFESVDIRSCDSCKF